MNEYPDAGPELDALVANRVMGITEVDGWPGAWAKGDTCYGPCCGGLPPFSTDIAAAWQVWERCIEVFREGAIFGDAGNEPEGVIVSIGPYLPPDAPEEEWTAIGPAPLAICHAALRAFAS